MSRGREGHTSTSTRTSLADTRWGCYKLLIALRPLPGEDALIRAREIDLLPLLRRGYTTREHIESATRLTPECGACQWWEGEYPKTPKLS